MTWKMMLTNLIKRCSIKMVLMKNQITKTGGTHMTFEELAKVNSGLRTTDIKGKAYAEVNERIRGFRRLFPNGTISTEIVSLDSGVVVIKATALDEQGRVLGVGHAYEKEGSTFINKTSYIENAETSAVGRALGMIGIGIDTSVASYEEVANAMRQQEKSGRKKEEPVNDLPTEVVDHRAELRKFIKANNLDPAKITVECGLSEKSTDADFEMALIYAKNMIGG